MYEFHLFSGIGGGYSEVCSTEISQSELLRLRNIAGKFLCAGNLTDCSPFSRSGMTLQHSGSTTRHAKDSSSTCDQSAMNCESAGDSPVRIYPLVESKRVLTVNVRACGLSSRESLMRYDPRKSCWKTPHVSLFSGWNESLPRLPQWGMMRNGEIFPLEIWGLGRSGNDGGYWGTVKASCLWMGFKMDSIRKSKFGSDRAALHSRMVRKHGLWPTPLLYERLMGFPDGWSGLDQLEMPSFQRWLQLQN